MAVHYFSEKTWVELEEEIKKGSVIILPVGTTEEHGRHLPVGTDEMIARGYADMLAEECDKLGVPVLVMETINFGFSMSVVRQWPGCPNIDTRTFSNYIFDIADSLVQMGFRKIVMLDCHGNHDCLLRMVMREIADKHGVYTMTLAPGSLGGEVYDRLKKDPQGDIHGGEYETSCILYLRPGLVKTEEYTHADAIRCNTKLRGPVSTWGLQKTTTGIYGDPTTATAELGKAVLEAAAVKGAEYIREYHDVKL